MTQSQFDPNAYKATQRTQWNQDAAPLRMTSAQECVTFERKSFGAFNQMMFHLLPAERASVAILEQYEQKRNQDSKWQALLANWSALPGRKEMVDKFYEVVI